MGKRLSLIFGLLAASAWAEDPESDFSREVQHGVQGGDEKPVFVPDPALRNQLKALTPRLDTSLDPPKPKLLTGGVEIKQPAETPAPPMNFKVACQSKRFQFGGNLQSGEISVNLTSAYRNRKLWNGNGQTFGVSFETRQAKQNASRGGFPDLSPEVASLTQSAEGIHLRGTAPFFNMFESAEPPPSPDWWFEWVADGRGNFNQVNITIPPKQLAASAKSGTKFQTTLQLVRMHWTKGRGATAIGTEYEKATCTVTPLSPKK